MILFILRHGMTAEAEADALRVLTEKGVKEVENVIRYRSDDLQNVTRMYSSPMIRVKQTVEIAAGVMDFQGSIIESQDLTAGSRLNEIVNFMNDLDFDDGDILVSSHQSCTSILVLWLTGEDVLISNGSLLAIDVEKSVQSCGKILWQESHNSHEVKRMTSFVDQF